MYCDIFKSILQVNPYINLLWSRLRKLDNTAQQSRIESCENRLGILDVGDPQDALN